jgi:hypothetical protein
MNPLHVRLLTILRNMNAPATAADIRAKCQLPQDLELIHHALQKLCDAGRAVQTDIGLFAHREYSPPEGLPEALTVGHDDTPSAPDVPGPEESRPEPPAAVEESPVEAHPTMTKTDQVLQVLQQHASSWAQAMTPDQIAELLPDDFNPNRVSAILCGRRTAGNTPELGSRPGEGKKHEWVWIEGGAVAPAENEPMPVVKPEPPRTDQAAMDDGLGALPRLADGEGTQVLAAIESMADSLRARPIRDRALKVAALDGLARIAPPPVAQLLRRIVAEDLFDAEA